ncbi:hypothetical protein P152DRAFT_480212 [Eremomyces bilateralis CBS 781.70]|uniref:Uncharacterized protein n=1 Tax=Eremomyces bilateralis CBS 781.70 TaxID=1392243 RepID=A0A6G1GAT2_9PEZI|nr:uncharacterized protein P152DRAFT_480212 [Eremomyces bilateralis CBS 781.70]KAF1815134.1 hypothetical protein P152DRAFT_480212 [Eremomyces bilateralis CBS 781.70]
MRSTPPILLSAGRRSKRTPFWSVPSRAIHGSKTSNSESGQLERYLPLPIWKTRPSKPVHEGTRPRYVKPTSKKGYSEWIRLLRPWTHGKSAFSSPDDTVGGAFAQKRRTQSLRSLRNHFLTAWAQDRVNILIKLGRDEGQWEVVHNLIELLVTRDDDQSRESLAQTNIVWGQAVNLDTLTETPINHVTDWVPTKGAKLPLDNAYSQPRRLAREHSNNHRHATIGLIWRTLAAMVLHVSAHGGSEEIMPHVLRIIATLHHNDDIPAAVYTYPLVPEDTLPLKSPLLSTLSTRILAALSDAALLARQERLDHTRGQPKPFSLTSSWTRFRSAEISHEVWIEFILSACLHGGWPGQGSGIIAQMSGRQWKTIDWRKHTDASQAEHGIQKSSILLEAGRGQSSLPDGLRHTVSWEVVAGIASALVNSLHAGVGNRGVPADITLQNIRKCKEMLQRNNMCLGTMSWDIMLTRLLSSEGVDIVNAPNFALTATTMLSSRFGVEIQAQNAPSISQGAVDNDTVPFEPSSASLGIMHCILRSHIAFGNPDGAMEAFSQLLKLTDENKLLSVQSFFRRFKEQDKLQTTTPPTFSFESRSPRIEYPNYDPNLSLDILGRFLDLTVSSGNLAFGKWLLYSEDVDGPMIKETDYSNMHLAPAMVRYAISANDEALLQKVLTVGSDEQADLRLLTLADLYALRHDWRRLTVILGDLSDQARAALPVTLLATVARALLMVSASAGSADPSQLNAAKSVYKTLLDTYAESPKGRAAATVINLLLASVDPVYFQDGWQRPFRYDGGIGSPSIDHFNLVLEGACACGGSEAGMNLLRSWCIRYPSSTAYEEPSSSSLFPKTPSKFLSRPPSTFESIPNLNRHAGVPVMRRESDFIAKNVQDVVLDLPGKGSSRLGGVRRLTPNASTIRALFRSALEDALSLPWILRLTPPIQIQELKTLVDMDCGVGEAGDGHSLPSSETSETELHIRSVLKVCCEEFSAMNRSSTGISVRSELDAALTSLFPQDWHGQGPGVMENGPHGSGRKVD